MTGITGMFFGGAIYVFSGAWRVSSSLNGDIGNGLALGYSGASPYALLAGNTGSGPTDTRTLQVNTSRSTVWTRSLTNSGGATVSAAGAAADTSYNMLVVSSLLSNVGASAGLHTAKIDTSGTLTWQRKLSTGGSPDLTAYAVATDSSDNVYVAGSRSTSNGIIAKYNSSGTLQWQRTLASDSRATIESVAVDSSGNVIVAGYYQFSAANTFAHITKYNSSGTLQWKNFVNLSATGYVVHIPAIVCDSSGNIYFYKSVQDGATKYSYYVKLDSTGAMQWTRRISASDNYTTGAAYIDGSGYIYFCHTANGGGQYIVKYDSSGTRQYDRKLTDITSSCGIVVDTDGFLWTLGTISDGTETYYSLTRLASDNPALSSFDIALPGGTVTVTVSTPAATENTTALTIASSSLTDAAGSYTDSAGALTSGTYTATSYTSAG